MRRITTLKEAAEFIEELKELMNDQQAQIDKLTRLNGATMRAIRQEGSITWAQYSEMYSRIFDSPPPN